MYKRQQIVNGSEGIVTGFQNDLPIVRFRNGSEKIIGRHAWKPEGIETISVTQLPLIYAWAITIHKSQGITLEIAEIDVGSHIFECGQTYVALSRVKSLSGLYLSSFNHSKIKVNGKVKAFYQQINHTSSQKQWVELCICQHLEQTNALHVSYKHIRAHDTRNHIVCSLQLEKK